MKYYVVRFGTLHRIKPDFRVGQAYNGSWFALVDLAHNKGCTTVPYAAIKNTQKDAWDFYNTHRHWWDGTKNVIWGLET